MSVIRFEKVCKSYNDEKVLEDFDLEVGQAETKIVLGGSGSGKSTILKLVLGLIRPDTGKVLVLGRDITRLKEVELMPVREQIGFVFQEGALFDSITVGENVGYRLKEQGQLREEEIREAVKTVLGFVGLQHTIDQMPSELSGGMKRRVAIARALAGKPKIMLYDEPTAGLDPITSRTICELVIRLRDLEGVTSIFVTHDLKSAMALAFECAVQRPDGSVEVLEMGGKCVPNTRFIMLRDGKILFEGTGEEMRNIEDEYIQEFFE